MPQITRVRLAILTHWSLDQRSLALRCGIEPARISRYANGEVSLTPPHRAILAHVLRVEPSELDGWIPGEDLWSKVDACDEVA